MEKNAIPNFKCSSSQHFDGQLWTFYSTLQLLYMLATSSVAKSWQLGYFYTVAVGVKAISLERVFDGGGNLELFWHCFELQLGWFCFTDLETLTTIHKIISKPLLKSANTLF